MKAARLLAAALVLITLLHAAGFAQESGNKPDPKTAPSKPRRTSEARPDEGTVADNVYSEKFFLLRYTIPPGWVVKTAEMREGVPGQENAILLLSAFAKPSPSPGEINASINISAENAAASPEIRTPQDYLESITEVASAKGFTVLNPPGEIVLGGVNFLREDLQKQEGDLTTFQATMVTMRRGYLLQITAISGNEEQLTPLLNRVQITAPPTLKKP